MSAETLRRAASLMRERASATDAAPEGAAHWFAPMTFVHDGFAREDAVHIASWHPGVALTVSAWLDSVADADEPPAHDGPHKGRTIAHVDENFAVAVARAYLGEFA